MRKFLRWVIVTLGILLTVLVLSLLVVIPSMELYRPAIDPVAAEWMIGLDDDRPLTEVTLPGTHNSAAKFINLGFFSKCQWTGISQQLTLGCRLLDVRLTADHGKLAAYHSFLRCYTAAWPLGQTLYLENILEDINLFLTAHPSETVIMMVKQEGGSESTEQFDAMLLQALSTLPAEQLYQGDSLPTVGASRGKLVLLRRYNNPYVEQPLLPAIYWADQGAHSDSALLNEAYGLTALVQDAYQLDHHAKWSSFADSLTLPSNAALRLNYLSTTGPAELGHPFSYAKVLNRWLKATSLEDKPPQWILLDFAAASDVNHLVSSNFGWQGDITLQQEGLDAGLALMNYLKKNFVLVLMIICLLLVFLQQSTVGRSSVKSIRYALFFTLILSMVDFLEQQLRPGFVYTWWRVFFSVVGYILRPAIAASLVSMVTPPKSRWHWGLIAALFVNALIYMTALFGSNLAFGFTPSNGFNRGPLGYSSHALAFVFILMALFFTLRYVKTKRARESMPVYIMAGACVLAAVLETLFDFEVINLCSVACCTFFYLHLHIQASSRDVTGLLNRQSYYNDCIRYNNRITAELMLDMNGLKYINDHFGHQAGDAGLKALANCFAAVSNRHTYAYRVGGDEFVILCIDATQAQVESLVRRIRKLTAQTEYTCSIGYAMRTPGQSLQELNRAADTSMYSQKANYYAQASHERRRR